jgi:hypothetical protein
MPVIGLFWASPIDAHMIAAFRRGLAEAGYVEGKNLAIEYRFTNFRPELLPEAAGDEGRRCQLMPRAHSRPKSWSTVLGRTEPET